MRVMVVAAALFAAFGASAEGRLPAGYYGWMADLAGSCWEGRTAEGRKTDVQCYFEQYGEYLRGTIEIVMPPGSTRPYLGDSVFTWDPQSSRIGFHYWGSGGNSGVSTGYLEGERIIFDDPPSKDPAKPVGRAVWTRLTSDSYRVTQQRKQGGSWEDLLSVSYSRVPASDAASPGSGKAAAVRVSTILQAESAWNGTPIEYPSGHAEVTGMVVEIAPGGETGWHLHPVPTFGMVLEGELEVRLKSGDVKRVKQGEALAEVVDTLHNGRNVGSVPLKLVVFYAGAAGQRLSVTETGQ